MQIQRAIIKNGYDTRQKPNTGALLKWEDIIGLKSGTYVDVIRLCEDMPVALISLPMSGLSPCGKKTYKPGTKRLISKSALEASALDKVLVTKNSINTGFTLAV
jgi:hypothetical protein